MYLLRLLLVALSLWAIGFAAYGQFSTFPPGMFTASPQPAPSVPSCSQSVAWLSGKTTTWATPYATLICGMVTDGTYSLLDRLYLLATDTSTSALTDVITNAAATITGAATFTANSGYVASTGTLNTTLNYSTATNYKQNSATLIAWTTGAVNDNGCPIGEASVASDITMSVFDFGSGVNGALNSGAIPNVTSIGTANGMFVADRSNSTTVTVYYNGASVGVSTTSTSAAPTSTTAQGFECAGAGGRYTHNVAMIGVGASLGATNEASLYGRIHTFLHAVNGSLYP